MQAVRSNAEQPVIANLRNLPGEQCSPLLGYAAISELRLDSSTTAPAGPSLRMTRPDNQTKQSQVGVEAGIARAVAASAATYLGVPLGTQGSKAQDLQRFDKRRLADARRGAALPARSRR